jgi:hypothetical protein
MMDLEEYAETIKFLVRDRHAKFVAALTRCFSARVSG